MEEDNVELVKAMLAAFGRRDLDAMLAIVSSDVQVRPAVVGGLEGTTYSGHDGFRDFIADLDDAWSEFRVEPEEFRALGDKVLVLGQTLAEGKESGVELQTASGFLFVLGGGKLQSLATFVSQEAALAAAGLSENVEIVRAHIDAFRAGATERSAFFMDEHVVHDWTRFGILLPVAYGIDGVVDGVLHYVGTFEDYEFAVNQLTDLGLGQVLAEVSESGSGKGSGVPVKRSFAVLYTVIEGKIVRLTAFSSVQAAREAIGAP